MAAIELQNPARDVVEEIAIVRDGDDRAGIVLEKPLEPRDRLRIEVVRRLVEQQQIGRLQEQAAQRHPAALAARQRRHLGVGRRQPERIHGELETRIQIPGVRRVDLVLDPRLLVEHFLHLVRRQILAELRVDLVVSRQQRLGLGHAFLDVAEDILVGIEPRLLVEHADRDAGGRKRLAEKLLVLAGHDLENGALPRAVQTEHADLGAGEKREPDVFEDPGVGRMHLPETLHGVDELGHSWN